MGIAWRLSVAASTGTATAADSRSTGASLITMVRAPRAPRAAAHSTRLGRVGPAAPARIADEPARTAAMWPCRRSAPENPCASRTPTSRSFSAISSAIGNVEPPPTTTTGVAPPPRRAPRTARGPRGAPAPLTEALRRTRIVAGHGGDEQPEREELRGERLGGRDAALEPDAERQHEVGDPREGRCLVVGDRERERPTP